MATVKAKRILPVPDEKPASQAGYRRSVILGVWRNFWPPALVILVIVVVWQIIFMINTAGLQENTFAYRQKQSVLPSPIRMVQAFFENADSFLEAGRITLTNAFIGFLIGGIVGYA